MGKAKKETVLDAIEDIKEDIKDLENTLSEDWVIEITEENAKEVAEKLAEIEWSIAAEPVPFEAPQELTLWWEVFEFNPNEFQAYIKEQLEQILERSQLPREMYNAKLKIKHELKSLINSI